MRQRNEFRKCLQDCRFKVLFTGMLNPSTGCSLTRTLIAISLIVRVRFSFAFHILCRFYFIQWCNFTSKTFAKKKEIKERSTLHSERRDSFFLKLKDAERAPACWRASIRLGSTTRDRLLFPRSPRDYSNIVQSSKQDSENATGSQDILTVENLNTLITPPFRGQAELCRTWFMIESLTYNCRKKIHVTWHCVVRKTLFDDGDRWIWC